MQMALKDETLPAWDLTALYSGFDDPKIKADFDKISADVQVFVRDYEGCFQGKTWKAEGLAEAVKRYEASDELICKIMSYAFLRFSTHSKDSETAAFYQDSVEKITELCTPLVFFTLDIGNIPEEMIQQAYSESNKLKLYKPWLDHIRLFQDHLLKPDIEKLLHEKAVTGKNAWIRLVDETLNHLKCPFQGGKLTLSEILNKLSDTEQSVRKDAAVGLSEGLSTQLPIFTLATNTLAKDKEIEDRWRKYSTPVASRNLSNQVEDKVVDALISAVRSNYENLAHRYYKLKAGWFGKDQLEYWDRNAPLQGVEDKSYSWEDSVSVVKSAYQDFSPEMAEIGQRFFDENWIDVPTRDGKSSGAYSHPTVPSAHPYIMLNHQGNQRDVMTLAHELGHGIHQVLSGKQGHLLSDTPLTVAETASVFGEMMTFKSLLAKTDNPAQRKSLLASKVEDMLNTVVRQIAFHDFELAVHTRRPHGELSSDDLGDIWMETQAKALGPSVHLSPLTRPYWAYITHFVHTPFYVYAYAFGDCLVNSLYAEYENGHPDFVSKYIDLLKAGGSKKYDELLAPFGLDPKESTFWNKGLGVISSFIDELETV